MTIIEIENMSVADIKARWDEAVASVKDSPDLADRYVQARFDAKQRDEKLSEQGRTITALNSGMEAAAEKAAILEACIQKAAADIADSQAAIQRQQSAAQQNAEALHAKISELGAALSNETARAERLKAQALRNQSAITVSAKALNDALSAQMVDNADQG